MRNIRNHLKLLSFFMIGLILFISCAESLNLTEGTQKISELSGKDIFKGIMFYEGEVAEFFQTTIVTKTKCPFDFLKILLIIHEIRTFFFQTKYPFRTISLAAYLGCKFIVKISFFILPFVMEAAYLPFEDFSTRTQPPSGRALQVEIIQKTF